MCEPGSPCGEKNLSDQLGPEAAAGAAEGKAGANPGSEGTRRVTGVGLGNWTEHPRGTSEPGLGGPVTSTGVSSRLDLLPATGSAGRVHTRQLRRFFNNL